MSGAKITGELLWDLHNDAREEVGDAHCRGVSWEHLPDIGLEKTQEEFNKTAKKLEDFLKYGKRPEGGK